VRTDSNYGKDDLTATAIGSGLVALVDGLDHYGADHLEGGRFHAATISPLDKKALTLGRTRSTNAVAEATLANVDRALSYRDGLGDNHLTGEIQSQMNKTWGTYKSLPKETQMEMLANAKEKAPELKRRYAADAKAKLAHKQVVHLQQIAKVKVGIQRDSTAVIVLAQRAALRIETVDQLDVKFAELTHAGKSEAQKRTFLIDQLQVYGARLAVYKDIVGKEKGPEGNKLCQQKKDGVYRCNEFLFRDLKTCISLCDGVARGAEDVNVEGTIPRDTRPPPPPPPLAVAVQRALNSEMRVKKLITRKQGRQRTAAARDLPTYRTFLNSDDYSKPLIGWAVGVGVTHPSIKYSSKPCWIKGSGKAVATQLALGVQYCKLKDNLPPNWVPFWDVASSKWYFWNNTDQQTSWDQPLK
jgi:hypothetical protein